MCSEESVSNREQLIHVSLVRYGCLCGYRSGRNIRNKAWLRCGSRLYRGRLLNNRSGCRRLYGFRLGVRCGCFGFQEIPVQDRFHRIFHGAAVISFRSIRCAGFFSLVQQDIRFEGSEQRIHDDRGAFSVSCVFQNLVRRFLSRVSEVKHHRQPNLIRVSFRQGSSPSFNGFQQPAYSPPSF